MLDWIKSHKILFVLSCIGVITMLFGIPFVINLLFKTPAVNELFQAEWDAGDALGYYGAVLSFIGTVVLGALALYQNHIIKVDSDRRAELLEEQQHRENMPRFHFRLRSAGGFCGNLGLAIHNVSNNSAYEVCIFDIRMKCGTNTIWEDNRVYQFHSINPQKELDFQIASKALNEKEDVILTGSMTCKDKYDIQHEYLFRMVCRHPNKYENTSIVEI